ncbi:hypothetical protein BJ741DRAFT_662164 [Chytriomyces cf. hyalinus JEL632]|nr:hypothetical protein BJ741DRAFT_662164 [Chytriomyces cf. hyalinus JEL632]
MIGHLAGARAGAAGCIGVTRYQAIPACGAGCTLGVRAMHGTASVHARLPVSATRMKTKLQIGATNTVKSNENEGEDESLLLESMPRGVTLTFFRPFLSLVSLLEDTTPLPKRLAKMISLREANKRNKNPAYKKPDVPPLLETGLRSLLAEVQSEEDAALFRDALARWHAHPFELNHDAIDNSMIADQLMAANAQSTLIQIALNSHKYGLYLNKNTIHNAMARFANSIIQQPSATSESASKDEQLSENAETTDSASSTDAVNTALDNLYKSFGLLLQANVEPCANAYTPLILAGAYGPAGADAEPWKRALISYNEAIFLGIQLPSAVHDAVVSRLIRLGETVAAAQVVEKQGSKNVHKRLRVEAFLMNGDLKNAVHALEYNTGAVTGEGAAAFGEEWWTPVDDVHDVLLAELQEKDQLLFERAEKLLTKSSQ